MQFILVIVALALFLFPAAFGYVRRFMRKRKEQFGVNRAKEAMESENVSGIVPATQPPLYPPELQESTVPKRMVSDDMILKSRLAPPSTQGDRTTLSTGLRKVQSLPPLKQAIVWADILSPPKALRDHDSDV